MTADRLPLRLDAQSPTPLYHQIAAQLRDEIEHGSLKEGLQLPSERVLAEQLAVSRMTIRQAVRSLISDGYCYRVRGRGIYVRQRRVVVDSQTFEGFTASMARAGRRAHTVGLGSRIIEPPEWVQRDLDLDEDEKVVELTRLRCIDDNPAILETEWFPANRFAALVGADLSKSLYALLAEKFGVYIAVTYDVLVPHLPNAKERDLLQIPPRQPVIVRNRVGSLADGSPIEIVRSVYNPDKYEFRMTLYPTNVHGQSVGHSPARHPQMPTQARA